MTETPLPTEPGWYWYRFLRKTEAEIVEVYLEPQPQPHLRSRTASSPDSRRVGWTLGEWLEPVQPLGVELTAYDIARDEANE